MTVTDVADATTGNLHTVPSTYKQLAGYTTGNGIAWTAAQWAAHPTAIRICQNPGATDLTADVLDVESGAATVADCPGWAKAALANWHVATRPGQRSPAIYMSQSNVTAVVNALTAAKVTGIGLFVADWTGSRGDAVATLASSGGPYPIIGVQWADAGTYDKDVFLDSWLNARSSKTPVKPVPVKPAPYSSVPPGQWTDGGWTWQSVAIAGMGLDGKTHSFKFDPSTGLWQKVK